ncbi:MAG: Histidine kinase, partial [Campylobacterota bacterium]|nr:Histidine kinase [Campylobacterota bacterium]
ALYEQIKPHFHHFQEIGIETVLFAFWDNKAFLRMHDPKKFDDTIEKYDSATYVNSTKKEMKGFELTSLSYKYTTPLYHKQTYLGAVSIGFSSISMQENITKLDHEDTYFIFKKSSLDKALVENGFSQSALHKDYVFQSDEKEKSSFMAKINTSLKNEISKNMLHQKEFALYTKHNTEAYIISFLPIRNSTTQEVVAYLVSYKKNSYLKDMLNEYIWINSIAFAGFLLLAITIYNNIKHKIELELKISQRTEELEKEKIVAQNATSAKSQFLAHMSHEIRTPMNGIIGITHLLFKTDLTQKQKHLLEIIEHSSKSLLGIINDILDFSKIEAKKLKLDLTLFDLRELVKNVADSMLSIANEKNIHIHYNFDNNLAKNYCGDTLRISQILTNLLSNAIKFSANGSDITITITKSADDRVRFEVKDRGIGLAQEQRENLFESFSQADSSTTRVYGGTGLGLTISKELVELMNGTIWVESELGEGSTFIFDIELEEEHCFIELPKDEQESAIEIKAQRILVTEDNRTNQLVLIGLLEDYIAKIDIANNGEEALKLFATNKYDLILMDLEMPIMDGYEATKAIRKIDSSVPILAFSANALPSEIEKTKELGMNEYITKPINFDEFFAILSKYIGTVKK